MSAIPKKPTLVNCPSCKQMCVFAPTNAWRPFCSERCKNNDLGAWASEQFRVPEPHSQNNDLEEYLSDDLKLENIH